MHGAWLHAPAVFQRHRRLGAVTEHSQSRDALPPGSAVGICRSVKARAVSHLEHVADAVLWGVAEVGQRFLSRT